MNYFEFYSIPISFLVEKGPLKKIFYKNSKAYHPDFYTHESEEKQKEILELSTLNNKAYEILSDFDKRLKYILEIKGILSEEGKNKIPNDFLMEMMEINEALMELEFDFDQTAFDKAKNDTKELDNQLYKEVESLIENYDDIKSTEAELSAIKNYFFKKRYLFRIFKNLNKFASA